MTFRARVVSASIPPAMLLWTSTARAASLRESRPHLAMALEDRNDQLSQLSVRLDGRAKRPVRSSRSGFVVLLGIVLGVLMPGEATGSISHFFAELRAGDASAVSLLWNRFMPRLLGLARKALAGRPQKAADADDVVQSAFASFWKWLGKNDFPRALRQDDLWNLLAQLTVRKALRHARREGAQKRGGGKVLDEAALTGDDGAPWSLDQLSGALPAADFDLHCEEMLLMLEEELRIVAILRLLGNRNREIADRLDCTERTVERKLALIRLVLERSWPE